MERKADYDLMAAVMICPGTEGDSGTDSTETTGRDQLFHDKLGAPAF